MNFWANLNKKATTVDKWLGLNKYQITRLISEQNFNDAYATRKRVAIFENSLEKMRPHWIITPVIYISIIWTRSNR